MIWFLFYVKSRRGISSLCCLFACVEHPASLSRLDFMSGGRPPKLSAASWDLSPELAPFGIACCLAALHRLSRCMILSKRKICIRHYPDTVTVSNDLLSGSGDLFQRIPRRLLPRLIMLSGHSVSLHTLYLLWQALYTGSLLPFRMMTRYNGTRPSALSVSFSSRLSPSTSVGLN